MTSRGPETCFPDGDGRNLPDESQSSTCSVRCVSPDPDLACIAVRILLDSLTPPPQTSNPAAAALRHVATQATRCDGQQQPWRERPIHDARRTIASALSGVAPAIVSYPCCDTDTDSGRQRAPPVSASDRAFHCEVCAHERNTVVLECPCCVARLTERNWRASAIGGRPHFRRSSPRSSSAVACQATSTRGER